MFKTVSKMLARTTQPILHTNTCFSGNHGVKRYMSSDTSVPVGEFSNKTVFVSGGSRGLGYSFVENFINNGSSVVFCATSEASVRKALEALQRKYPSIPTSYGNSTPTASHYVHGVVCDVADMDNVTSVWRSVSKFPQPPSILINAAGICVEGLLLRADLNVMDRMFKVNVLGTMAMTKAFLRGASSSDFYRVICIGSVVSKGAAGLAGYSASKAAVEGFVKSMAKEVTSVKGNKNITFNVVAPGFIQTDMTAHLTDTQKDAILTRIPSKTMGEPQNVAEVINFVSSRGASYVNGQVIGVDGGM